MMDSELPIALYIVISFLPDYISQQTKFGFPLIIFGLLFRLAIELKCNI